jgi:hypothetical protein
LRISDFGFQTPDWRKEIRNPKSAIRDRKRLWLSPKAHSTTAPAKGCTAGVADCGLRIADLGFRISNPGLAEGNPQSEIRNPKSKTALTSATLGLK